MIVFNIIKNNFIDLDFSDDFLIEFLDPEINNVDINIIWLEIFILFVYWLWLVVFYFRLKKNLDQNEDFNNDFT